MENGIQDKIWDIRIFGHTVRINKCPNNDAKSNQQSITVISGQICYNLHGRHSGIFKYQGKPCQTCQNGSERIKTEELQSQNRKMQVSCSGNNVSGLYDHPKKHSDGND